MHWITAQCGFKPGVVIFELVHQRVEKETHASEFSDNH